jgi:GTP cyclohydrolase IIa
MLQSKIYYDVQRLFSEKECLVYSNRFDEYIAISNGLSVSDHIAIHNQLTDLYSDFKLSMTIGRGETPFEANISAHKSRQSEQALNSAASIFGPPPNKSSPEFSTSKSLHNAELTGLNGDFAQIMHIDVNDSRKIGFNLTPYEVTSLMAKVYSLLSEEFLKKNCMAFYLGGDNFMVISNDLSEQDAKKIISGVGSAAGVKLNCGIGVGHSGRKAADNATKALDTIRDLRGKGRLESVYKI